MIFLAVASSFKLATVVFFMNTANIKSVQEFNRNNIYQVLAHSGRTNSKGKHTNKKTGGSHSHRKKK